jgi:ribosomal protein S18 acetylase RimI-like enzyme
MASAALGKIWLDLKMSVSSNEHIRIRTFQYPDDLARVLNLWGHAGPGIQLRRSDEPEQIQKKLQRDPDLFLLAEVDNELVGAVLGGFDGRRGIMYHLAVDPPYRRQGIGEVLMQELERRLVEKGCIRYYLLVTKDNQEALRFYEARGCQQMELYVYGKDLD